MKSFLKLFIVDIKLFYVYILYILGKLLLEDYFI